MGDGGGVGVGGGAGLGEGGGLLDRPQEGHGRDAVDERAVHPQP